MFYKGFMHKDYKKDEAIMRRIVSSNVAPTDPDSEIDLIIYYKNKRTSQMLMKNSPRVDEDPLKKHGVVYCIICPENGCPFLHWYDNYQAFEEVIRPPAGG